MWMAEPLHGPRNFAKPLLRTRFICRKFQISWNLKNSFITSIHVINNRQKNMAQADTSFTSEVCESFSVCRHEAFYGKREAIISDY